MRLLMVKLENCEKLSSHIDISLLYNDMCTAPQTEV